MTTHRMPSLQATNVPGFQGELSDANLMKEQLTAEAVGPPAGSPGLMAKLVKAPVAIRPTPAGHYDDADAGEVEGFAELDPSLVELFAERQPRQPLIFPLVIENFLDQIASAHSLPKIMATSALLVIAAAAIGIRIRVKAGAVWSEPPILWACVVTPAGWRRMSIATAMSKPLRAIEEEGQAEWREASARLANEKRLYDAALKNHAALARRAEAEGNSEPPAPMSPGKGATSVMPQIFVHEIAAPAVVEAAAAGRGVLYMAEEGSRILRAARIGEPLHEFILAGYGGDAFNVPRAMHDDINRIEAFGLPLLIGVAPVALTDLKIERDDHVFTRAMWIVPSRKPLFTIARKSTDLRVIERLMPILRGWGETGYELVIERRAIDRLEGAVRRWEHEAARLGGGPASSWMERAGTHAMRVALVIEMIRAAVAPEPRRPLAVSSGSLNAAIRFVDSVLIPGMMDALAASGTSMPASLTERLARYLFENKLVAVNRRDLSRNHRGVFPDGPALRHAFDSLVIAGVLRGAERSNPKGRPSVSYDVNPRLCAAVEKRRLHRG